MLTPVVVLDGSDLMRGYAEEKPRAVKEVPNSLTFSQAQVNFILGHSIASMYQGLLKEPVPEHLRVLLAALEEPSTSNSKDKPKA